MKTIAHLILSGLLVFVCACTPQEQPKNPAEDDPAKDDPTTGNPSSPQSPSVITASFPAAVITKVGMTVVPEGLSAVWNDDDFLTVSNGTKSERFIITSISEDGKTATLEGEPIEGDSFDILLTRFEEDYLDRTYKGQKQLRENSVEHMLTFDALLEDVDTYADVTFTKDWAEEHSGSLTQSGGLLLSVELPDDMSKTAVVEHISLNAQSKIFHTTNNPEILENTLSVSTGFGAGEDGRIDAYLLTSMATSTIPTGSTLSVVMTVDGVNYIRSLTVQEDIVIAPSRLNTISIDDQGWQQDGTNYWLNMSECVVRYVNITANNGVYGELSKNLFDNNVAGVSVWHAPWGTSNAWYDRYFEGWTVTEKTDTNPEGMTNGVRLPMVCVIDLCADRVLNCLDIKRRAVDNGSNKTVFRETDATCIAEVWVSTDRSNESGTDMLSITESAVLDQITQEYSKMWAEKKWHKVGDVSWDKNSATYINDVVARLWTEHLYARYIKLVIPGPTDIKNPILNISDIAVFGY